MASFRKTLLVILFACASLSACKCTHATSSISDDPEFVSFSLNESLFWDDIKAFTQSPHPFGSERQKDIGLLLKDRATAAGSHVYAQDFKAQTPIPDITVADSVRAVSIEKQGSNIIALAKATQDRPCVILFGSHYDTKIIPGIEYVGANDSASSSVLLLQMLKHIEGLPAGALSAFECGFGFIWFDGEEAVLPGWAESEYKHPSRIKDNTYGSRYAASKLEGCKGGYCFQKDYGGQRIAALINMDMVGSKDLKFSMDAHSHPKLNTIFQESVKDLGFEKHLNTDRRPIEDDHIPFLKRGVPAVNMIDFENLYTWHTNFDHPDQLSEKSVQVAARIALEVAKRIAADPSQL